MKENLIFVYGSLVKGFHNDDWLQNTPFVGRGTVNGLLYDVAGGGFPGMVPGKGVVHGEVYRIEEEALPRLDSLEGFHGADNPFNLYNREKIEVTLAAGGKVAAWAYFFNHPVSQESFIPSGDWRDVGIPREFEPVVAKGNRFLFLDIREKAKTSLERYPFKYDIRHDDEEWEPSTIEKYGSVTVNWFGTLFSKENVFPELKKHGDFVPIDRDEFGYL